MERIGVTGENGTLKALGLSGFLFLKTITDADTITKAVNVPMLVSSETTAIGVNPAIIIVTIPTSNVLLKEV
jgi:hypothetical protein